MDSNLKLILQTIPSFNKVNGEAVKTKIASLPDPNMEIRLINPTQLRFDAKYLENLYTEPTKVVEG